MKGRNPIEEAPRYDSVEERIMNVCPSLKEPVV